MVIVVLGITPTLVAGSGNGADWADISTTTSSSAATRWFFDTVETSATYDIGEHVSLALDSNDTPYISYYEASHQMLQMAKYVGAGGNCGSNNDWVCETVDHTGNVGKYSSIAIDPTDDLPKIAYYDDTANALKLATLNAFGWNIQTIDAPSIGDVGQYASLALNDVVKVGIAY